MDCHLPGSSVHGILQARMLEWVAISFSRGSSQPRNRTRMSCIAGGLLNYRRILYCLSYKGGDLPKMREASTEEPALDPSLLLSCCCPSFRFSLTHFPSFSLGYIGSLCDGTSSRKPSLNCWVGSVPPQVSMAPVFPSVLQWQSYPVDLSSLEMMVLRSWIPFNSQQGTLADSRKCDLAFLFSAT